MSISEQRRREVIDALRRGTVPSHSLDALAVGLGRFEAAVDEALDRAATGQAAFKAVRGEYGAGKTFFTRWLAERARARGFASSEVQISETETPLHHLETVYRRLTEQLATAECPRGALRQVIDAWFYALEQDVLAEEPSAGVLGEADLAGARGVPAGAAAGEDQPRRRRRSPPPCAATGRPRATATRPPPKG